MILDLHHVPHPERAKTEAKLSMEAKLTEAMLQGLTLREAQEMLTAAGEKKNAVKQAAINLKKLFETM